MARSLDPGLASLRHLSVRVATHLSLHHRQPTDRAAVEEALEADPDNAALKLDAALYFLASARTTGDASLKRSATDRVFELLEERLARGLTRQHLVDFAWVAAELRNDPRWPSLEA